MNFKYKELAKKITNETIKKFYIGEKDIFQKNVIDKNDIFFKPIDIGDNTIPNGNALMLINLVRLGMNNYAEKLSNSLNGYLNVYKSFMPSSVRAIDFYLENRVNSKCSVEGCKV